LRTIGSATKGLLLWWRSLRRWRAGVEGITQGIVAVRLLGIRSCGRGCSWLSWWCSKVSRSTGRLCRLGWWRCWSWIVQKVDEVSFGCDRSRCWSTSSRSLVQISQTGKFGSCDGLTFFGRHVRIFVRRTRAVPALVHRPTDHLRCSQLKDLGHFEVGASIDSQVKRLDLRHISIGWLRNEMCSKWRGDTGHTEGEMMLKDLICRPTVLSSFRVMHVLSVG
jgi:hypothetical protein